MWHILYWNGNVILSNDIYHTTLYFVMDETTKVISHMCHGAWHFVWEKLHYLVVNYLRCYYLDNILDKFESKPMDIE